MQRGVEVHRQFFESRTNPTEFLGPTGALLNHMALAIRPAIKSDGWITTGMFIVPMRYHRFYPLRPEPIANSRCTVTFVADQLPGLASPTMLT